MATKPGNIKGEDICSTGRLAEIIGLSDRRIRQLEEIGVFKKISRGKYALSDNIQAYIQWLKEQAAEKYEDLDLTQERTLLTKAQREKAEIELAELRDEIYRADYIIPIMQDLLLDVRNRLLAIPQRCAPQVMATTELIDAQEVIKAEVYDALTELAAWTPDRLRRPKRGEADADSDKD